MHSRLRRRAILAALVPLLVGLAAGLFALPATAAPGTASDGSAGRPTPSSGPVLALKLGHRSLSVHVASISIDVGPIRRAAAAARPSPAGSRPPAPHSSAPARRSGDARSASQLPAHHRAHDPRRGRQEVAAYRGPALGGRHSQLVTQRHRGARAHARSGRANHRTHHGSVGAQLLHDITRPGSPAQLLLLLVLMCAVGTALVVSLGRRRDPKPERVKTGSRHR